MHHDSSKFQPRQATAFYYLNDVTRGGETYFPAADGAVDLGTALAMSEPSADGPGLAVKPRRGTAVIFYNHDAGGALEPTAVHAGCRVMEGGEKWAANQWVTFRPPA